MSADARRHNAGRGDGLTHYVTAARDTAPEGVDDPRKVLGVAWAAFERGDDPADVWAEVVEE